MAKFILYYHAAIHGRYVLVPSDAPPSKEVRQYRTVDLTYGTECPPVFASMHHLSPLLGERSARGEGGVYTVCRNTLVSQRHDLAADLGVSGDVVAEIDAENAARVEGA